MSKHTPGPWVLDDDEICSGSLLIAGVFPPKSFTLPPAKGMELPSDEDCYANAHLIAAAPELLEALKAIYQDAIDRATEVPSPIFHAALAAIAKAEGRSK